jgi:hypothetical protein
MMEAGFGDRRQRFISMEDIVAAKVRDESGRWYGFMTWGRIADRIDDAWIRDLMRAQAASRGIRSIAEIRICQYFYEGLFHFANAGIPLGPTYETWRQDRLNDLACGVYFLGEERENDT